MLDSDWLFQVVVAGWFLFVALYLASSGEQEFKVVIQDNDVNNNSNPCDGIKQCLYTTVNNTQEYYKGNDSCVLEEFSACRDACPRASCQFVKYIKNKDYSWMQFINVFGLYWGIFFFAAFGEMVLAGVYAQWYWAPKDNKNVRLLIGFKWKFILLISRKRGFQAVLLEQRCGTLQSFILEQLHLAPSSSPSSG